MTLSFALNSHSACGIRSRKDRCELVIDWIFSKSRSSWVISTASQSARLSLIFAELGCPSHENFGSFVSAFGKEKWREYYC